MEYFPNISFSISLKPKATIVFTIKSIKAFSLTSETWQGHLLPLLLFKTVLEVLTTVISQERNERSEIWKRSKIIILELENPKEPTEKPLETVREFKREVEFKLIYRNQYFSYL